MQHPQITLIVKYPNDTLKLATQPQLENKYLVKCPSCSNTLVSEKGKNTLTCSSCQHKFECDNSKEICTQGECKGEIIVIPGGMNFITKKCNKCHNSRFISIK